MLKLPGSYSQILRAAQAGHITGGSFGQLIISHLTYLIKVEILNALSSLLPIALSVAGAILVVTVCWRLFRNFTKG